MSNLTLENETYLLVLPPVFPVPSLLVRFVSDKCSRVSMDTSLIPLEHTDTIQVDGKNFVVTDTQEECIQLCQNTKDCYVWNYFTTNYHHNVSKKRCVLMKKYGVTMPTVGVHSGTRFVCKGKYSDGILIE